MVRWSFKNGFDRLQKSRTWRPRSRARQDAHFGDAALLRAVHAATQLLLPRISTADAAEASPLRDAALEWASKRVAGPMHMG